MNKYAEYKAFYKELLKTAAPKWLKVMHELSQVDKNKLPYKSYETMYRGLKAGNKNILKELENTIPIMIDDTQKLEGALGSTTINPFMVKVLGREVPSLKTKPAGISIKLDNNLKNNPLNKELVLRHEINEVKALKRLNNDFSNPFNTLSHGTNFAREMISNNWSHASPEVVARDLNILGGLNPKITSEVSHSVQKDQFKMLMEALGYDIFNAQRNLNKKDIRNLRKFETHEGSVNFADITRSHDAQEAEKGRIYKKLWETLTRKRWDKGNIELMKDLSSKLSVRGTEQSPEYLGNIIPSWGVDPYRFFKQRPVYVTEGYDGYAVPIAKFRDPYRNFMYENNNFRAIPDKFIANKDGIGAVINKELKFIKNKELLNLDTLGRLNKLGLTIEDGRIVKLTEGV